MVREEYEGAARGRAEEGAGSESLHKLFTGEDRKQDLSRHLPGLKSSIMEALQVGS